jgi:hypothetical protein
VWSSTRTSPSVFTAICTLKHGYNLNEINVSRIQAWEFMLPSDRTVLYPEIRQIAIRVFIVNMAVVLNMFSFFYLMGIPTRRQSQWPRGLRRAAARLLRLWARVPPGA